MRKMRFGGRMLPVMVLGIACAGAFGLFVQNGNSQERPTVDLTATNTERILPSQVTLSNVEAFKEQVRRDLPLSTPKEEVEAYLTEQNIRHSFVPPSEFYGPDGNAFYGTLENIGMRTIFMGSLAIRIFLDDEEKVREIVFRIDYDAP